MLYNIVTAIDRRLRAVQGVTEYTGSPQCIFRIQVAVSNEQTVLGDGTVVCAGHRIIILHLWNEQIPRFPVDGPKLSWALAVSRRISASLSELEQFLASRPELSDILAIKAYMTLGAAERTDQLASLAAKYGFERIDAPTNDPLKRLHRFGENILIAMLVLLSNPASFRFDTLRRTCTPVFISRAALRERFGSKSDSREQVTIPPQGTSCGL